MFAVTCERVGKCGEGRGAAQRETGSITGDVDGRQGGSSSRPLSGKGPHPRWGRNSSMSFK